MGFQQANAWSRLPVSVLVLVVFALILSACGGGSPESTSSPGNGDETTATGEQTAGETETASEAADPAAHESELMAAMDCDGGVTWYGAHDPEFMEEVATKFEEKYGTSVEVVRTGSSEVASRTISEHRAGGVQADLVTAPVSTLATLIDMDIAAPYESPVTEAYDPDLVEELGEYGRYITLDRGYLVGPAYNTDNVSESEAPTAWADLTDETWQGRLITPDPRYGFTYSIAAADIASLHGWEYWEQIGDLDLRISRGGGDTQGFLASGERDVQVYAVLHIPLQAKLEGEPVDVVLPEEGPLFFSAGMFVTANASCPNAAKLLVDFVGSSEMQERTAELLYYSPRTDAPPPAELPPLDEVNWRPAPWQELSDPDALEDALQQFDEALGR